MRKWRTVRSQRPDDEIWARQVAGDTLADRFDVLEGPLVPHEAWATSKLLLTYGIMSRRDSSWIPTRQKFPRRFFLAAPPRPPPRRQSPRKASFPPVGPLPRGQSPFPTAPRAPRCPRCRCPRPRAHAHVPPRALIY